MNNMIHGPCGDWCLIDGKCSKHYPKEFREDTAVDDDAYPYYRRRNTRKTYTRNNMVIDNRYVVPYCPMLSLIFNCHLNVEVVSSIRSVKYLYKYIYKGHDVATVTIGESADNVVNHDEIKDFVETRYVGPVEACWRIFSKPLFDKSHSITRLPIHLPNQQNIVIEMNNVETNIENAMD